MAVEKIEAVKERDLSVMEAGIRLSRAVLDIQAQLNLTYNEVMHVLSCQIQTWSKYAIKEEGETK